MLGVDGWKQSTHTHKHTPSFGVSEGGGEDKNDHFKIGQLLSWRGRTVCRPNYKARTRKARMHHDPTSTRTAAGSLLLCVLVAG